MTSTETPTLNQGQQAAADGFFEFLLSDDKELIISGPGGVGKTFLMGWLIDRIMPQYHQACKMLGIEERYTEVQMTATTNKAAEVLGKATGRPVSTLHSFMALKPQGDFETGASKIVRTNAWKIHENLVLFIDEASMMDTPLRKATLEGTHNCKIVYVGDHCQLAPVMEPISPIYRDNLPFFELTEPMRNADQPALMHLCAQWRHAVETGEFYPIEIVPGVVDHFDDDQMQAEIDSAFVTPSPDRRILSYTNHQVGLYNSHVRDVRGLPEEYVVGDLLVNNNAMQIGKDMLRVEEEVEILAQAPNTDMIQLGKDKLGAAVELEVRYTDLKTTFGMVRRAVPVPVNRDHFLALIKYFASVKNWPLYFKLKENYPDLRPRDACTLHKSQGSTYETSYIDLSNVATCHQADQVARMLYVGVSRARSRVVLYGQLPDKYGGPVIKPEDRQSCLQLSSAA